MVGVWSGAAATETTTRGSYLEGGTWLDRPLGDLTDQIEFKRPGVCSLFDKMAVSLLLLLLFFRVENDRFYIKKNNVTFLFFSIFL